MSESTIDKAADKTTQPVTPKLSPQASGAADVLSDATKAHIDHWITKFPDTAEGRRSAIIQSVFAAQEQNGGWLSEQILNGVADYLQMPAAWVYEVASFYSMFDLKPVGRHKISVCTNISCMLRGADGTLKYIEDKLGITLGQTTPDGRITLKVEEECLAACVRAPMMVVDGHYHENLTPEKIDQILEGLE